jgi:hypothetical protein
MSQERKNTAIFTAFDDMDQPELATPERNLLRAILINAIADMNRQGEESRRAKDYFLDREDDYVFSFKSVCSYLNIDPQHILILVGLRESPRPLKGMRPTKVSEAGEGEGCDTPS